MTKHLPLKDYPESMQPRERLEKYGPQALSDAELLAMLLGSGSQKQTALDLAQVILARLPNQRVRDLLSMSFVQLKGIHGVGAAKACALLSAAEMGRRLYSEQAQNDFDFNQPAAIAAYLYPILGHLNQEQFCVLLLNSKLQLIRHHICSIGLLSQALIHPREVFAPAIEYRAHAVVLAHNHPSGNAEPSAEDRALTSQLIAAGQLLQIEVLDHLIIAGNHYTSLRESTLLWRS